MIGFRERQPILGGSQEGQEFVDAPFSPLNELQIILQDETNLVDRDIIQQYLFEISQYPLLDASQEIYLAQQIELGKIAEAKLLNPALFLTPEEQEEHTLIALAGIKAAELFTRHNVALVVSIAKRLLYKGVPFPDLIQEGNLGLIRAVEKFDHRKGYRFSTYATYWIKQAINRNAFGKEMPIHIPGYIRDRFTQIYKVKRQLFAELNRYPTIEEIVGGLLQRTEARRKYYDAHPATKAKHINTDWITVENVRACLDVFQDVLSLNAKLNDDEDSEEFGDMLSEVFGELRPLEQLTVDHKLYERILELISYIPEPSRTKLILHLGLGGDQKRWKYREIGHKYGISRQAIYMTVEKAKDKLRFMLQNDHMFTKKETS